MKVQYRGFLGNVDSSILDIKLDHNFFIETVSESEIEESDNLFRNFLNRLKIKAPENGFIDVLRDYNAVDASKNRIYFVRKDMELNNEFFLKTDYVDHIVSLMRLVKEGNVYIALHTTYDYINLQLKTIRIPTSNVNLKNTKSKTIFSLDASEIKDLQFFLDRIEFPISQNFLKLAIKAWELHYYSWDDNLEFIGLFIPLESLFLKKELKKGFHIARYVAALLGADSQDIISIFKEIIKFYMIRNKIIHAADFHLIDKETLQTFRNYVRKSVKRAIERNIEKPALTVQLDQILENHHLTTVRLENIAAQIRRSPIKDPSFF